MLRILDARTGEPVPAAPARRGLTRIETHASGLDPTALRVLLTADLLVRALELGGTPVWTILTAPRDKPELRTAATRLAIRPFEDDRDLASGLGEAQVIHVARWPATGGSGAAPGERDEIPAEDAAPGEPAPARASEQRGEGPSAAVARGERAEGPAAGAPGGPAARPTPPVAPEEPEDEAPAAVARGQRGETPTTPAVTPGERTGRPGAAARPQARAAGATPAAAPGDHAGQPMASPAPTAGRSEGPDAGAGRGEGSHAGTRRADGSPSGTERGEGRPPGARSAGDPAAGSVPGTPDEGPLAAVAPVEWVGPQPPLPALLADPAALRLALLSVPRHQPARLDGSALDRAAGQLADWRRAVAGWARRPSRPVPEPVRGRLRAAWENDLDLPGVLDVLRDVARDPDLPDGARFETYAYADRLLALDLSHDLGSPA